MCVPDFISACFWTETEEIQTYFVASRSSERAYRHTGYSPYLIDQEIEDDRSLIVVSTALRDYSCEEQNCLSFVLFLHERGSTGKCLTLMRDKVGEREC